MGIVFALLLACAVVFVSVRFPFFHQATGFGPDWDCKVVPQGEPVCIKKLAR